MPDAKTAGNYLPTHDRAPNDRLLGLLIEMSDETCAELPIALQVWGIVGSGKLNSIDVNDDRRRDCFVLGDGTDLCERGSQSFDRLRIRHALSE